MRFFAESQKETDLYRGPSSQRLFQAVERFRPLRDEDLVRLRVQHNDECVAWH